jgi:uncharacterized membrane protein
MKILIAKYFFQKMSTDPSQYLTVSHRRPLLGLNCWMESVDIICLIKALLICLLGDICLLFALQIWMSTFSWTSHQL